MIKLEELQPNASIRGILPDSLVTVVNVEWFGSEALELTYKEPGGRVANQLLYRHDEPRLEIVEQGRPWSFDGDGSLLRLVSEAHRIRLAYLFDPVLAVHTSLVDPLPRQIAERWQSKLEPLRDTLNKELKQSWQEWQIPREAGDPWDSATQEILYQLRSEQARGKDANPKKLTKWLEAINHNLKRKYAVQDLPERPVDPWAQPRMNADLHTGKGNLFVIFGEPDIEIIPREGGKVQIRGKGVDVFHPQTGEVRSDGAEGIACWFIDTDYNEESFFARHAYFLGANDPYRSPKTTLKAEINEEAWATLNSDTSRPFDKPKSGRIAVKVINHLGDEVMKGFKV